MSAGYNAVAEIIGQEMDALWVRLFDRLSQEGASGEEVHSITEADLHSFFANLGGAQLAIEFCSIEPKGEIRKFSSHSIKPSDTIGAEGIEGSISIGVNIKF